MAKTPYGAGSGDNSLLPFFGWAGSQFPFVPSAVADIVISAPTTWSDAVGYKQVGKLTINAGQVLSINKSPFYIFCNELNFGDTASIIDASGFNGNIAGGFTALGGGSAGTVRGGDGGGMLFIIAGKITGASGVIKANGGNGYGTASGSSQGGQGALSKSVSLAYAQSWDGTSVVTTTNNPTYLNPLGTVLGSGGNSGGSGGGSGASSNGGCGGSGIGGGGCGSSAAAGLQSSVLLIVNTLIELAKCGCRGGGGGGGNTAGAGGGGGGSVAIWTHSVVSQPVSQANGGSLSGTGGAGAAGVTYFILL
jgi:hypothetical protein